MSSSAMSGPSACESGCPARPAFSARSSSWRSLATCSTSIGGKLWITGSRPCPGSMMPATRSLTDFAIKTPDGVYRRRAMIGQPRLAVVFGYWAGVATTPAVLPMRMPYLGSRGEDVGWSARGNQVYAHKDDRPSIRDASHLHFRRAYHVGQTGILRRIVGREGVTKPPGTPVAR